MTEHEAEKILMELRDQCNPSERGKAQALSMAIAALRRLAEIRRLVHDGENE